MKFFPFILGVMVGALIIVVIDQYGENCFRMKDDTDEMQRRYEAYRVCIPNPRCMTAEDYIDYYDLKWRLENDRD